MDAQSLSAANCSVLEPRDTSAESLDIHLIVRCDRSTKLALPVTYNTYTHICSTRPDGGCTPVPYFQRPTDPRMVIDAPAGQETLLVSLPDFWRILF